MLLRGSVGAGAVPVPLKGDDDKALGDHDPLLLRPMDASQFDWTVTYVVILSLAALATATSLLLAFKDINRAESAVQNIAFALCRSYLLYSVARWAFYVGVLANWSGVRDLLRDVENGHLVGVRVVYAGHHSGKEGIVLVALLGDIALLCTAFWVITLAYEMTRLITKSMDRGRDRERRVMRLYNLRTYGMAVLFGSALVFSAWLSPRQEHTTRTIAFAFQLTCVWASVLYPLYCTLKISFQKRTHVVINPVSFLLHQRIKRLVIVYLALVFPSCVVELIARTVGNVPIAWIGLSQALYYLSGVGTAFVMGASVTCCYRTLQPIMPAAVYEHLLENGYFPDELLYDPTATRQIVPPHSRPIFVSTDIEGSTALWAQAPEAMAEAQNLHDDLLRQELVRFRGYEITTIGDAFQLAFHTVSDAIAWCIDVQEKLLKVPWPADLLRIPEVARVHDHWGRIVFAGLRVRMAIHDGDEKLICYKHPTTHKITYMGLSEIVAREMGDFGHGGEIHISETAWQIYEREHTELEHHRVHGTFHREESEEVFERLDLMISLQMYRLVPSSLGDRLRRHAEHNRPDFGTARMLLLRAP